MCLYIQGKTIGSNGIALAEVIERLGKIKELGCETCGSIPINDAVPERYGRVKVNYVHHFDFLKCGKKGLCILVSQKGLERGGEELMSWGCDDWSF